MVFSVLGGFWVYGSNCLVINVEVYVDEVYECGVVIFFLWIVKRLRSVNDYLFVLGVVLNFC